MKIEQQTETNFNGQSEVKFINKSGFRNSASDKMNRFTQSFFDSIQIIVIALAVVVLIYLFVASFNIVDGISMFPTLKNGDLIISEKITTNFGSLKRGDVIVFQAPTQKDFIKRIIGLPGDTVKIEKGKVYVNNTRIEENYLSAENKYIQAGPALPEGTTLKIPDNHYIVMGDNRGDSLDSRVIGPVEKSKIKGKAWLLFWPLDRFHVIEHIDHPELDNK